MNTTKKKVPIVYYQEMVNELGRTYSQAKAAPARQRNRINAVMASGLDYEVMPNGMTVSLKKLLRFHKEAKKVDLREIQNRLAEFVSKHEPNKNCKEQLEAAKYEASAFSYAHPEYFDDEHNFDLLHDLSHKYFLSERKMDLLMGHFMKIGLLY